MKHTQYLLHIQTKADRLNKESQMITPLALIDALHRFPGKNGKKTSGRVEVSLPVAQAIR
jgi:hypothetical protein